MVMKKVCVIGAGAAGLCAARHCISKQWDVVIFEKSDTVGGTWVYTDDSGSENRPVHSSMYKSLQTNLPKEVMNFPDFPFPDELPSFMTHGMVLAYLSSYAIKYNIIQVIKFNHTVLHVDPLEKVDGSSRWKVTTQQGTDVSTKKCQIFDVVFVCSGHFAKPYVPTITGQKDFAGFQIHSHYYREPSPYCNKRVACLGAGPSGVDISIEVASCATCVYLCHGKEPYPSSFPENLSQKPPIREFNNNSVVLTNGETIEVDVVIYCTGYCYSFNFLDEKFLQVSQTRVSPLYLHLVHANFTTIFFVGLCFIVCPFPHFDVQIRYALSVLSGTTKLPSKVEMNEWVRKDFEYRKLHVPSKQMHFLGPEQWNYLKHLADLGKFSISNVPPVLEQIYSFCHQYRAKNFLTYRNLTFNIMDQNTFTYW